MKVGGGSGRGFRSRGGLQVGCVQRIEVIVKMQKHGGGCGCPIKGWEFVGGRGGGRKIRGSG